MESLCTVFWQNTRFPGSEICSLYSGEEGHALSGIILAAIDEKPIRAVYRVDARPDWRTSAVCVDVTDGKERYCLDLTTDGDGRWFDGGKELEALRGCLDIDLGLTPSTNTLPIRRLNLIIGRRQMLDAAWVRFPELQVSRLAQRYVRLSDVEYRYENPATGFNALLSVDEFGMVEQYEGIWVRAAG